MAHRGAETVTRVRAGRPDEFGDNPSTPDDLEITGCEMIPRGSSENDDRESTVITGMTLVAPAGADIKSTDKIEHLGISYEVEGDVARYRKRGREVQVIAALKRVTG